MEVLRRRDGKELMETMTFTTKAIPWEREFTENTSVYYLTFRQSPHFIALASFFFSSAEGRHKPL